LFSPEFRIIFRGARTTQALACCDLGSLGPWQGDLFFCPSGNFRAWFFFSGNLYSMHFLPSLVGLSGLFSSTVALTSVPLFVVSPEAKFFFSSPLYPPECFKVRITAVRRPQCPLIFRAVVNFKPLLPPPARSFTVCHFFFPLPEVCLPQEPLLMRAPGCRCLTHTIPAEMITAVFCLAFTNFYLSCVLVDFLPPSFNCPPPLRSAVRDPILIFVANDTSPIF